MGLPPNMRDYEEEYRTFSLTVPEYFSFPLDVFDRWGQGTALFWTDGKIEKKFTFNELKMLSSKAAGALKREGLSEGDKVLVMLPNIPQWWEVMLGLMRINAVPVPATTLLSAKDIAFRISAADIRAVISTEDEAQKIEGAVDNSSAAPLLFCTGPRKGWLHYPELCEAAGPFEGRESSIL